MNEPIASSKTAASSGWSAKYSKESALEHARERRLARCAPWSAGRPSDCQTMGPPKSCAAARNEPGPLRRRRADRRQLEAPVGAPRRTRRRWRAGAARGGATARGSRSWPRASSCVCGPSARRSAMPRCGGDVEGLRDVVRGRELVEHHGRGQLCVHVDVLYRRTPPRLGEKSGGWRALADRRAVADGVSRGQELAGSDAAQGAELRVHVRLVVELRVERHVCQPRRSRASAAGRALGGSARCARRASA